MEKQQDFTRIKTSWTKYDIVQALDVIYNIDTIHKFINKEVCIDEPILRSFLGISSLQDPIPEYWKEIQKYPKEKKIFAFLALLFTHGEIVKEFAEKYATGHMKGIFQIAPGKQYTNIRSALVESGAAEPAYRRSASVPYDISIVFYNPEVGKLFKSVLLERLSRLSDTELNDRNFYDICQNNNFHKALSITEAQFRNWLEGKPFISNYIQKVKIENFFSIKHLELDFENSKEVYFLGENGDGKTLLLMALYLAFNGNYITNKTDQGKTGIASDIFRKYPEIILRGVDTADKEYSLEQANYINNIYAYGTHRGRYSTEDFEVYGFMSLFDFNQTLKNPIAWLKDQKLLEMESFQKEKKERINSPFEKVTQELEKMFFELLERNVEITIEGDQVVFTEKGYKLTFDQLSEGYREIILFVSDLLFRLSQKSVGKRLIKELRQEKGIVLVDEIDLHLHPKWQRKIIKKLRAFFPNIQFFFTTHSPTVIQGASEDSIIYRIYRENAETKSSDLFYRKDLNHLMLNTLITSPLFGLEDSRLDSDNEEANTDDNYSLYKVNKQLNALLQEQKTQGKNFISDRELDSLINSIIRQAKNDKDK